MLRYPAARIVAYLVLAAGFPTASFADDPPTTPPAVQPSALAVQAERPADPAGPHSEPFKNAPAAVRAANQRLLSGDPESALAAYRRAEALQPDAREIAFGEGLAQYDLGAYEPAREAFRKAAAAGDDLAVDSRYSLATCDHREALEKLDQPKEALSLIENAMRGYHDVLTERPDHAAARDANFKAASMWRQIKHQMEQQEQQQKKDQDGKQDEQKENDEKKKQDSQQKQDKNGEQKDQQQSSESQDGEKQEDQKSKSSQDEKDQEQKQEQQQSQSEKEKQKEEQKAEQKAEQKNKTEEQEAKQAEEKEKVSREQAERKLREMVQAMRDRKKGRRRPADPVRARPVDKDW